MGKYFVFYLITGSNLSFLMQSFTSTEFGVIENALRFGAILHPQHLIICIEMSL